MQSIPFISGNNFIAPFNFFLEGYQKFIFIHVENLTLLLQTLGITGGYSTVVVLHNTIASKGINNFSFQHITDFRAGISPGGVAVGDLAGDGKPDLAVANQASENILRIVCTIFFSVRCPGWFYIIGWFLYNLALCLRRKILSSTFKTDQVSSGTFKILVASKIYNLTV